MRYHAKILHDSFYFAFFTIMKKTEMKIWSQSHFKSVLRRVLCIGFNLCQILADFSDKQLKYV
jgi:hypothetical protein